jgi:hypothetical protein
VQIVPLDELYLLVFVSGEKDELAPSTVNNSEAEKFWDFGFIGH